MTRRIAGIALISMGFWLMPILPVSADDTEIYMAPIGAARPNVLIVFDNSKDMSEAAAGGQAYDPAKSPPYTGTYTTNTLYKRTSDSTPWVQTNLTLSTLSCTPAYNALSTVGQWSGQLKSNGTCGTSGASRWALGNFLNYNSGTTACTGTCPSQVKTVRDTVASVVWGSKGDPSDPSVVGVNFGLMVFGANQSGGRMIKKMADISSTAAYNAFIAALPGTGSTGSGASYVEGTGTALNSGNGTPLSESLYDAGAYFAGYYPMIGGDTSLAPYPSPITDPCQKNFVIVITNGSSTNDCANPVRGSSPTATAFTTAVGATLQNTWTADPFANYTGSGICSGGQPNDYMDNVARYLYKNDLLAGMNGKQNVEVFTISVFSASDPQLQAAANQGGGNYYTTNNVEGLSAALTDILDNVVLEVSSSFVAPVVPVSPSNRTFSGSNVYIGFFKPKGEIGFWSGNVKKYALSRGKIMDSRVPAQEATETNGSIKSTAVSYWSSISSPDGGDVEKGGVGQLIYDRVLSTRNLYSYLDTASPPDTAKKSLNHVSNGFNTTNITASMLGVTDNTNRDRVVKFVQGYDAVPGGTNTNKRQTAPYDNPNAPTIAGWIMGDVLHSRPAVVNYSASLAVVYVGGNDGMLHAFRDNFGTASGDGEELWGFIPPEMLVNLDGMTAGSHEYFVDGSPSVYYKDNNNNGSITTGDGSGDQVILIFGAHRGSSTFWALDVTNPSDPKVLWKIDPGTVQSACSSLHTSDSKCFSEMGQSWSQPQIGYMNIGGTTTPVFFIGGGYDTEEDLLTPGANTKGRAVYAIKVLTGEWIWEYSNLTSTGSNDSGNSKDDMTKAIPSDVTTLDANNDGLIDRVYVGDMGGRMWRFDVGNSSTASWTGRIIFNSNPGNDGTTGRKIFYPPDVTFEIGYEFLFFGTGDREHPRSSTSFVDRLYAVKDRNLSTVITEGDSTTATAQNKLLDVTSTLTSSALSTNGGWYIRLSGHSGGEKALAPAVVFNKVATFTTYAPNQVALVGPGQCSASLGTAYVYSLNYLNGNAAFDYDGDGTKTNADREKAIGAGIPSGAVVAITEDGAVGLVGVGGGIEDVELEINNATNQLYWHQLH